MSNEPALNYFLDHTILCTDIHRDFGQYLKLFCHERTHRLKAADGQWAAHLDRYLMKMIPGIY